MKNLKKFSLYLVMILLGISLGFFLTKSLVKPVDFNQTLTSKTTKNNQMLKKEVHYVSLGDSLTEGIGDPTKQGGFVPLISQDIKNEHSNIQVTFSNYGKSGDRSDQILKRLKESNKQQQDLKKADFITLTVGGNDLMKVIKKDIFNDMTLPSFKEPAEKYQASLTDLLKEIRMLAPQTPLYVFGIYNPFYVYFKDIEELQEVVTLWNETTEKTIGNFKPAFFIPINELISKGSLLTGDSQESTQGTTTQPENDLIYEEDNFHPNLRGYQYMAQALNQQLEKTTDLWLMEEMK